MGASGNLTKACFEAVSARAETWSQRGRKSWRLDGHKLDRQRDWLDVSKLQPTLIRSRPRLSRDWTPRFAAEHEQLAQHFARGVPPIAMWRGITAEAAISGAPLLTGEPDWLECRLRDELPVGKHTLFEADLSLSWLRREPCPLQHLKQAASGSAPATCRYATQRRRGRSRRRKKARGP